MENNKEKISEEEIPKEKVADTYKIRTMEKDVSRLKGETPSIKEGAPPEKLPIVPEEPKKIPIPTPPTPPEKPKEPEEIKKSPLPEKPKSRLKPIIIILLILIILIGGGGFYYWWNYMREVAEEEPQKPELEIPLSLIDIDETGIIAINEGEETTLFEKLKEKAAESRANEFFRRILVKKITHEKDSFLNLKEIFEILDINIPAGVSNELTDDHTMFIYSQEEGNRLGIVTKITNIETLRTELGIWETTMKDDLTPLFLGEELDEATEEFQDNIYKETNIRYLNFPSPDLTIDYAIVNDLLIITTSKESMYRTISELLEE